MIVKVHMLAFCSEPGEPVLTRDVELADENWNDLSLIEKLEQIFYYGQNDFQPREKCPSVSMGDVIDLEGQKYIVLALGFGKCSEETYQELLTLNHRERQLAAFTATREI